MSRRSLTSPVVSGVACLVAMATCRNASAQSQAEQPPTQVVPVDVAIHEPAPPRRFATVEWNFLPFIAMHTGVRPDPGRPQQGGLGKLSANVVLAPLEHHAIIVSPFYVLTRTTPIRIFDDDANPTELPIQTFRGYGTELGYRYYSGRGGIRGFFAGPSLIVGSFTATAENGEQTPYIDYGVAVDAGYQALVVDRVALSLGAGLQYTTTSKPIPDQMLWAKVFANTAVLPRFLISVGWAL